MDILKDRKKELVWSAVALLLAVMFLQAVLSMRLLSATFDETTHLPSGYSYLATGDFRLNPQHPPLIKLLSALPLLPLRPEMEKMIITSSWDPVFMYCYLKVNFM